MFLKTRQPIMGWHLVFTKLSYKKYVVTRKCRSGINIPGLARTVLQITLYIFSYASQPLKIFQH